MGNWELQICESAEFFRIGYDIDFAIPDIRL